MTKFLIKIPSTFKTINLLENIYSSNIGVIKMDFKSNRRIDLYTMPVIQGLLQVKKKREIGHCESYSFQFHSKMKKLYNRFKILRHF